MKSIIVENLSKCYHIKPVTLAKFGTSLRDTIYNGIKNRIKKVLHPWQTFPPETIEFWALRDVNLAINPGDRVGIIGKNGAGKSTLLKILARITEPTTGRITLRGRVASLLEVATGFHPDLTGRENIFLNGAILGMTHQEMRQKFEEIVEFADIANFLDTPVKQYSSGMYVRLAFSIPAHIKPEILLVDEVLAVGDVQFQKKCLGKMSEITHDGRTVLFVTHNMNAIEQFCNRVVFLENGNVTIESNNIQEVVQKYLFQQNLKSSWSNENNKYSHPFFSPLKFYLGDASGKELLMPVSKDQEIYVYLEFEIENYERALMVGYAIYNEYASLIYITYHTDTQESSWPKLQKGLNRLYSKIPEHLLNEGEYRLECIAALYSRETILEPGKDSPNIMLKIQGGLSNSPYWTNKRMGAIAPEIQWFHQNT